jgi:hypothetical protein
MKILSTMLFACALSLGACGPKAKPVEEPKKDETIEKKDETAKTTEGTPCAQELALQCPDGQIDGCLKTPAEGTTHACVAK